MTHFSRLLILSAGFGSGFAAVGQVASYFVIGETGTRSGSGALSVHHEVTKVVPGQYQLGGAVSAEPGTLKSNVYGSAFSGGVHSAEGSASITLTDSITFTGHDGQAGSALWSFHIPGFFSITDATELTYASAAVRFEVIAGELTEYSYVSGPNHFGLPNTLNSDYVEVPVQFTFGVTLEISLTLETLGMARSDEELGAGFAANFGQSVYSNGFSSVLANGVPLLPEDYSVTSTSGVDYTQSFVPAVVPEPEAYAWCGAVGLVGFSLWRRMARTAGRNRN